MAALDGLPRGRSSQLPPLRDDAPEHYAREALLVASFIIYLSGKLKSSIKGRTYCKPATYMVYVYAVKRVHVRHFKLFQAIGPARGIIKALNDEYVLREGPECLIPARKEPISRGMVRAMLAVVDGASLPGAGTLQWQSWRGVTLRALLCTAASGGFRKAELSLPAGIRFNAAHMSRANLFWVIGGVLVRCPTPEQLRNLKEGDMAGLIVVPCKNDLWGIEFMPHPLFFRFVPGARDNTAAALRDMVLACPVPD